ncbi:hypothetical protein [Loktanella sp. M215]|uniref:hypothetical protein n=1 Tax=Loktanella sp. M215 TaxID=2675431 RepID=UPI001F3F0A63|nr:hypothetical protein [Loktanella sp. M215]MCF7699805.1 hypothetical protein [Loktanella sp. M215]
MPILIVCLFVLWIVAWDNPRFARDYFRDIVPISHVMASKRWSNDSCVYAIARLGADAPEVPPVLASAASPDWLYAWPDDWLPTPIQPSLDTSGDPQTWSMFFCAYNWPKDIADNLATALMTSGSFYNGRPQGQDLYIYAPGDGLIARIRYGD